MKSTSSLWAKFRRWASSHPKASTAITIAMVIAGSGALVAAIISPSPQAVVQLVNGQLATKNDSKQKYYSPLTGAQVDDEAATKQQVRAIMIENSPSARPQSGLKESGIVFEAIAEGGITRLLTLHQEGRPEIIGPVRSLRPYYIDWLAPFDATVSHVGGSANALAEIRNGTYKDVDQFFNGKYYWRATDRAAPHNVYTNSQKLEEMNNSKGYTSSSFTAWPRKAGVASEAPNATKIDITVSSPTYNVHYDYDAGSNNYIRSIGGAAHKDREKGQITPSVVIAIKVPTSRGFEDGWREQMSTTGQGTAYVFQDGQAIEATWYKSGKKDQIMFYDKLGKLIPLSSGQTWVTIVAPEKAVAWQ